MLSKKYYKAIAEIIKKNRVESYDSWLEYEEQRTRELGINVIAEDLAQMFIEDNPHFDRERFLKACGINQ